MRAIGKLLLVATVLLTVSGLGGCAATKVVKNPGPKDKGIRYYRPKPYLMTKPGTNPGTVDLSITYLPDYNEEYSIQINAGLGTNNTNVTLDGGWNLTAINVNVDSKASELLTAATGAAGLFKSHGPAGVAAIGEVEATDVPIGLYEAVTGLDNCGQKQLYGWRYVGFMPFAQCPTVSSGGPYCTNCDDELWGMVWFKGKLTFRKIKQIANTESDSTNPPPDNSPAPTPVDVKAEVKVYHEPALRNPK